jgi:hypothetical protein
MITSFSYYILRIDVARSRHIISIELSRAQMVAKPFGI